MTADKTPVQQHLDNVTAYTVKAGGLLTRAEHCLNYGHRQAEAPALLSAADVWARLAQAAAIAAQTAATLTTNTQEQ